MLSKEAGSAVPIGYESLKSLPTRTLLALFQPFQKKKNANTTLPSKAAQTPRSATDDGQNARSSAKLHSACQDGYCNNLEAYGAPQSPRINADIIMSAGVAGTITSLSDEMAEADTVGHCPHGTVQFTLTHTEWQAMRNDLSEFIKKTRKYDLITLKTQVHDLIDFSDDSAERTPVAKCTTQPEILDIGEEEEAVAARAEVQLARESALHERVVELEVANKSLLEYSERVERRAQKMGSANLRVLAERDEVLLQCDGVLTTLYELTLLVKQLSDFRTMLWPPNPYAQQLQQHVVAHQEAYDANVQSLEAALASQYPALEAQRKATLEQQQKQLDTQGKLQRQDQLKKQQEMQYQQMPTQMPMQQSYGYSTDAQYMPQQTSGVKYGAAMPAQQTSSMQFSAAIPAWQTSSMQYGGYGASKSLHATLHAAPFIPTPHGGAMPPVHCSMGGAGGGGAEGGGEGGNFFHPTLHAAPFVYTAAAQRQEHNYWSLQRHQQQRQEEQNIVEQQRFHKQQFASIQQPDTSAAPFIPTPHGGAMHCPMGGAGGRSAEGGEEGGVTRDLCVAGEGQEGGGDSHAGKTKNNGAHGDQRGAHEQPLVQEQQPSLQPQPQSQQSFDNHVQLSAAVHILKEEKSEKSRGIKMLDRTAQPSECRMCKKKIPSRNSMFRHLTERHQFYQENQHKSKSIEEEAKKQSLRTCDESNPAQWPPAGTWLPTRKGRSASRFINQSGIKTLSNDNRFATLSECGEDEA